MAKRQPSARARRPRVWVVEHQKSNRRWRAVSAFPTKAAAEAYIATANVFCPHWNFRVVPYERVERGR